MKSSLSLFTYKLLQRLDISKVKGKTSRHLHKATYRETQTEAVYNLKWCTDQH